MGQEEVSMFPYPLNFSELLERGKLGYTNKCGILLVSKNKERIRGFWSDFKRDLTRNMSRPALHVDFSTFFRELKTMDKRDALTQYVMLMCILEGDGRIIEAEWHYLHLGFIVPSTWDYEETEEELREMIQEIIKRGGVIE